MWTDSKAAATASMMMMMMMMMMMSMALTLIIGNAEQLLSGDLDGRGCPVLHLRCLRHDDAT